MTDGTDDLYVKLRVLRNASVQSRILARDVLRQGPDSHYPPILGGELLGDLMLRHLRVLEEIVQDVKSSLRSRGYRGLEPEDGTNDEE